jgi:hypothetical protein
MVRKNGVLREWRVVSFLFFFSITSPPSKTDSDICIISFLWKYHHHRASSKEAEDGLEEDNVDVYKWTGKNDYVALCEPGFISFGGG